MGTRRTRALIALALCAPAASLGAASAFVWFPGAVGNTIYSVLRAWMALVPLVWLLAVERRRPSWSPVPRERRREAVLVALATSVLTVGVVALGWTLLGREHLDVEALSHAAERFGLSTSARYIAFGAYITLVNSLVEEYVWRWFVHERCADLVGPRAAVPLGAALFTAHHVIVFVGELGPLPGALASLGVFVAGCAWSAMRARYRSIWPAWPSHVVADAAGLFIGWRILFG